MIDWWNHMGMLKNSLNKGRDMKVTVIDREKYNPYIAEVTIEIADNCPVCGQPRGVPFGYNFYEDGGWYWCNRWDNPCGHIDHYDDCLKEADKRNLFYKAVPEG